MKRLAQGKNRFVGEGGPKSKEKNLLKAKGEEGDKKKEKEKPESRKPARKSKGRQEM